MKHFDQSTHLCLVLFDTGRRVGYAEFGNLHRVPNPNHHCEDPFEDDEMDIQQNVVDSCEKHVGHNNTHGNMQVVTAPVLE